MSDVDDHRDEDDVAPGFMDAVDRGVQASVLNYVAGLGLAALLTAAAFYTVYTDVIWQPAIPIALAALAVAQIGVHLVFFLHITTAPDNTNNVLALAFGVLIVALIIGGSVWIMDHMNHRMMPTAQTMEMQSTGVQR
jgi:cytochrome o ubiquinol oxidase operon protein cyoD